MPHLVQMQESYEDLGLAIIGVTDATADEALAFAEEYEVNFPLLSEAATTRDRYGIDMIWGSVYYLVGPTDTIVAGTLPSAEEYLQAELGTP